MAADRTAEKATSMRSFVTPREQGQTPAGRSRVVRRWDANSNSQEFSVWTRSACSCLLYWPPDSEGDEPVQAHYYTIEANMTPRMEVVSGNSNVL